MCIKNKKTELASSYAGLKTWTLVFSLSGRASSAVIISPLPVQYAVPVEKKKVMSEPISPDQVWRSSNVPVNREKNSVKTYKNFYQMIFLQKLVSSHTSNLMMILRWSTLVQV